MRDRRALTLGVAAEPRLLAGALARALRSCGFDVGEEELDVGVVVEGDDTRLVVVSRDGFYVEVDSLDHLVAVLDGITRG